MSAITTLLAMADAVGFNPGYDFLQKLYKELRKTKVLTKYSILVNVDVLFILIIIETKLPQVRRPDIVCKYSLKMLKHCADDVEGS